MAVPSRHEGDEGSVVILPTWNGVLRWYNNRVSWQSVSSQLPYVTFFSFLYLVNFHNLRARDHQWIGVC